MFNLFKTKINRDNSIAIDTAIAASSWWTEQMKKTHSCRQNNGIRFLIERKNPLSDEQAIIFNTSLSKQLVSRLCASNNGFLRISASDDASLSAAAYEAGVHGFPEDYFPSNVIVYIEDEKIFIYEEGRDGTVQLKRK